MFLSPFSKWLWLVVNEPGVMGSRGGFRMTAVDWKVVCSSHGMMDTVFRGSDIILTQFSPSCES